MTGETRDGPRQQADAGRIREQAAMRAPLPKRFYKDVSLRQGGGGWSLLLDGREVKTPGKRKLVLPTKRLGEGLADEWRAQETVIDPASMPLTRIANSAIEAVTEHMAEVAADVVAFAGSDLVCYRAAGPEALVARQSRAWEPVVAWASSALHARFALAEGVMPVKQPQAVLDQVAAAVAPLDAFKLAGLHVATTLTGSALLALAALKLRLTPQEAWAAAHVDEDYQIELWGEDAEARSRRAYRWSEMQAACAVMNEGTKQA